MRVWLDDIRDPKNVFIQERYGSHGDEIWVKTVDEAIELLKTGKVESISLDNDLGDGVKEGYHVADWLEEQAFIGSIPELDINVHSDNTVAKERMLQAIRSAYRYWSQNDVL
jgi:hypothetical protein